MLENYGHLLFVGLIVSKPDLVSFLEQRREPWDLQTKKTVAIHPAVSSHDTPSFLSELCKEASFPNVSVGPYKHSVLEKLHLMIDWDNDHKGYIQIEATSHNKNLTAPHGEGYKTLCKTFPFQATSSIKQSVSVGNSSNQILKDTYLWKDNVENLESYHAEDNNLNNLKNRIRPTFQSNMSKHQRFTNEEATARWFQFERSFTKDSTLQNDQTIFSEDRLAQGSESEEQCNQGPNVDKHLRTHSPETHSECNTWGDVFHQRANLVYNTMHRSENPYKYNDCENDLNHSTGVGDHPTIHGRKKPCTYTKPGNLLSQSSRIRTHKTVCSREQAYKGQERSKAVIHQSSSLSITQFIRERNLINVNNVAKHLSANQNLLNITELIQERNLIYVKNVARPLTANQTLFDITNYILERNLTNVKNVARPLTSTQTLLDITDFILERSLMNVRNVARPLYINQVLLNITKSILGRNLMNVKNVARHLSISQALLNITEFTLKRNLINVRNVAKLLTTTLTLVNITESILERNLINVKNVAGPTATGQALFTITNFILERNLMNVKNVARLFSINQALVNISEFILERNLTNVNNAARVFISNQTLLSITKFILERDLINVTNVGRPLSINQTLFDITGFILEQFLQI
ncbi:uncharacterized protein [Vulpes vulpes]|uniref:KRAB domain-containing protein n=1 Tax=Vulpes vulpes TaxID=9627 RepID=A0ABM5AJW3_VULVU